MVGLRNYRWRWCRHWRGLNINRGRLHINGRRLDVGRRHIHRRGTHVNAERVRAVMVGNSNPNSHSPPRLGRRQWQNQKGESDQRYYSSEHRSILLSSICWIRLTRPIHLCIFGMAFPENFPVLVVPRVVQRLHQLHVFLGACHQTSYEKTRLSVISFREDFRISGRFAQVSR